MSESVMKEGFSRRLRFPCYWRSRPLVCFECRLTRKGFLLGGCVLARDGTDKEERWSHEV